MSKGLSKGITKENIVNTTLELIRNRENIRSVNLREIARILGCAHTNLYNHFSDLDAILWEAVEEILKKSYEFVHSGIDENKSPQDKLQYFYQRFIDFYLENRGWFRLFWIEKLQGEEPEKIKKLTQEVVGKYVNILADLFEKLYSVKLDNTQTMHVFHTVHCYLYGEISIFTAGRGMISDEKEFGKHVGKECIKLSKLLVMSFG